MRTFEGYDKKLVYEWSAQVTTFKWKTDENTNKEDMDAYIAF